VQAHQRRRWVISSRSVEAAVPPEPGEDSWEDLIPDPILEHIGAGSAWFVDRWEAHGCARTARPIRGRLTDGGEADPDCWTDPPSWDWSLHQGIDIAQLPVAE
jgi:hypothetical protein